MTKLKGPKNAAILLIIVPFIILISYLSKPDFGKNGINNYLSCGALLALLFIGVIGLRNSLNKEKESRR